MKLKITERKDKPFTGDEGTQVPWAWYVSVKPDGFIIRFGSGAIFEIDQEVDINLEKIEKTDENGKDRSWLKHVMST